VSDVREPQWIAHLNCGHETRTQGRPAAGSYVSCPSPRCQGQERVTSVSPVLYGVPGPVERGVQEPLWKEAA